MSRKDALRSYRRAFKRAYMQRPYERLPPTHPLMVEMGKRGDRLHRVFGFAFGAAEEDFPNEVIEAMTSRDLHYLANDSGDECPF